MCAAASLAPRIYNGQITGNVTAWVTALSNLYMGNATYGNIFNGDELAKLGMQFGTNADPQSNLYIERAFQAVRVHRRCSDADCCCTLRPSLLCLQLILPLYQVAAGLGAAAAACSKHG